MSQCVHVVLRFLSGSVAVTAVLLFCGTQLQAQEKPTSQPPATATEPSTQSQQSPAGSIGVYVYPKNNQSSAQQQQDERECYSWSKQQTGIDPAAPPPESTSKPPETPKGGALKGAARGAAAGSAVGAVANDDAGGGAATGATVGAIRGRRAQKKAEKEAEKQSKANAQAAQKKRIDEFRKGFSACMEGRQYSVK